MKTIQEIAKDHWENCNGCDENDKNFWINGFAIGYNVATIDLLLEIIKELKDSDHLDDAIIFFEQKLNKSIP